MSKLRIKIDQRMDELQAMMESNMHLEKPILVAMQIESVSKFWSVLSEEDRDYIHGCQFALEEKQEWNV